MAGGHKRCIGRIRKNERLQQRRDPAVQPGDIRQAAAEHDDVRIEHIDDTRERPRQPRFVDAERAIRAAASPRSGERRDVGRVGVRVRRSRRRSPRDRARKETSRCSPCARSSTPDPGARRPAARAADCVPILRRCDGVLRARGRSRRRRRRCPCRGSRRTRCARPARRRRSLPTAQSSSRRSSRAPAVRARARDRDRAAGRSARSSSRS